MAGFSMQTFKKHPALIPLVVIVGAGGVMAVAYTIRLATKCPDVSWNPKNNPEPWQRYSDKQYKFIHDTFEPSKAPKY